MEQKFKDFLAKYNNQYVERVDSNAIFQCFDLAIAWCEWLGLPISIFSGLIAAHQIYNSPTKVTKDNFTLIPNTPDAVPKAGDIVVWSPFFNGGPGHVGIATGKGDTNSFECFEQNDPTGSKSHVKVYNYGSVLGWLRYKLAIQTQTMNPEQLPTTLTNHRSDWKVSKDILDYESKMNEIIKKKDEDFKELEKENIELSGQIETERDNHKLELEAKDKACDLKIKEIQAIPPKVITKTVEMPYQFNKAVYKAMDEFIKYIDKNGLKLPVSGDVRK